jgi:hypothetical protein
VVALAKAMKLEVNLVRIYSLPAAAYLVGDGIFVQDSNQSREEIRREAETTSTVRSMNCGPKDYQT